MGTFFCLFGGFFFDKRLIEWFSSSYYIKKSRKERRGEKRGDDGVEWTLTVWEMNWGEKRRRRNALCDFNDKKLNKYSGVCWTKRKVYLFAKRRRKTKYANTRMRFTTGFYWFFSLFSKRDFSHIKRGALCFLPVLSSFFFFFHLSLLVSWTGHQ